MTIHLFKGQSMYYSFSVTDYVPSYYVASLFFYLEVILIIHKLVFTQQQGHVTLLWLVGPQFFWSVVNVVHIRNTHYTLCVSVLHKMKTYEPRKE